jgi:C-methyltransferase
MLQQEPHELLWTLTNAGIAARCLQVVADLGVADVIGEEPVHVDVLGRACGVNAGALNRVLRLLVDHGVFAAVGGGYRHTAASELLRSDQPMSMRAFPQMMGTPVFQNLFARLDYSLRTGSPAIDTVEPKGFWAYYDTRPDEAEIFGRAMTAKSGGDIAAVLDAYDFSSCSVVADIGGGRGHLLQAVLEATPHLQGVLFDLPEVINHLHVQHARLISQAGDFFADQLPVADAYLLMEVLHDWPDTEAAAILAAINRAASPGARVLVIENVLEDEKPDPRGHTLDVIMLAVTGGRERTTTELSELFRRAGFTYTTTIPTAGPLRIVEATASGAATQH